MAAQLVHAAGESAPGNLCPGTYAVVLAATQEKLKTLSETLTAAGIRHRAIIESDPPYCGQLMAIGLAPAPRQEVKRHVSSFPLLR